MSTAPIRPAQLVVAFLAGAVLAVVLVDRLLRLTVTPEWLQAVGGLGAFGATAWLAWLTLRHVHTAEQMAAAGRENQVAIARALLEDLKRIRSGLGPVPQGETVPPPAETLKIPRVHSWLEPIIPQIALSDAAIVGGFMALEQSLDRFDTARRWFYVNVRKRNVALQSRDGLYEMYRKEAERPGASKPEEVGTYIEASKATDLAYQEVREAARQVENTYQACSAQVTSLEQLLLPIART